MRAPCTVLILSWESGIIDNVLLPTCEVVSDYVEQIVIAHCGLKSQMFHYEPYKKIGNVQVVPFDYTGKAEFPMRFLTTFVPDNQWIFFMDSDQRPVPSLLEKLEKAIEKSNELGLGFLSVPTIHHEFPDDPNKPTWFAGKPVPQDQEEVVKGDHYTIKMLMKKTRSLTINTNGGMHYRFDADNTNWAYFPHALNHYKLNFEYYSSVFLSGYSNPLVHTFSEEDKARDAACKRYYDEFEDLKKKYNMPLSNDFQDAAYRHEVPDEFFKFFSNIQFERVTNPDASTFLNHAGVFCRFYDFSFDTSLTHKRFCGKECCQYNGRQL